MVAGRDRRRLGAAVRNPLPGDAGATQPAGRGRRLGSADRPKTAGRRAAAARGSARLIGRKPPGTRQVAVIACLKLAWSCRRSVADLMADGRAYRAGRGADPRKPEP